MRKTVRMLVTVAVLVAVGVLFVYLMTPARQNAKVSKAQLGAKSLEAACHAYAMRGESLDQFPNALADLLDPPVKGEKLLKNGAADLLDPWGKPYGYELRTLTDGVQVPFIHTTSPDGVAISQYGIGPQSQPPTP